jgi:hypothetical protein
VTCPLPLSIVIRPPLTQRHALTTSSPQKIGEKSRYSDLSNAARTVRGGTLCNKESSATTWRKKHQEYQDGLTEAEDGREYDDYYDDNEADTKAAKALAVIDHTCDPEDDYHPPEGESAVQRDAPPDIALPTKKIAKVKTHGVAVLKQKRLAVIKNSGLSMSKKARKQRKHRRAQWPRLVADARQKAETAQTAVDDLKQQGRLDIQYSERLGQLKEHIVLVAGLGNLPDDVQVEVRAAAFAKKRKTQ